MRAILIAVTAAGGSLLMAALKIGFHRHRPEPFFDTRLPSSYSFPSGHAMLSFCLCLSAAALFSANRKSPSVRIAISTFWIGLSLAIGYSRIYLGVHYPSDVIAGYLGDGPSFDEAIAQYAIGYADQAEKDFAIFQSAIHAGKLPIDTMPAEVEQALR